MSHYEYAEGDKHGLQFKWNSKGVHEFAKAECYDQGSEVWACAPLVYRGEEREGGEGERTEIPWGVTYGCSTREEAEALAAEHGCP